MKNYSAILPSPFSNLGIHIEDNKLTRIDFLQKNSKPQAPKDNVARHVTKELQHYLKNPQHIFGVDMHLEGTPFQKKVWKALRKIPSGSAVTYGMLAKQLKTSPRAIGNACRSNPIPVIIPCHRVVAQNHIGGYAGKTQGGKLDIKKWLLQHENQ